MLNFWWKNILSTDFKFTSLALLLFVRIIVHASVQVSFFQLGAFIDWGMHVYVHFLLLLFPSVEIWIVIDFDHAIHKIRQFVHNPSVGLLQPWSASEEFFVSPACERRARICGVSCSVVAQTLLASGVVR